MVAVVVPSPASFDALDATSFTICAPMFSYGSSGSISLATVTPSLVTVGEPKDFSRTTFRPEGPRVTLTARASFLTPRRIASRASWSKAILLAAIGFSCQLSVVRCQLLKKFGPAVQQRTTDHGPLTIQQSRGRSLGILGLS